MVRRGFRREGLAGVGPNDVEKEEKRGEVGGKEREKEMKKKEVFRFC